MTDDMTPSDLLGVAHAMNAGDYEAEFYRRGWMGGYAAAKAEAAAQSERAARAEEIEAGLAEIGTGGTPAFIRGYNAGFDDALAQQSEGAAGAGEAPLREALLSQRVRETPDGDCWCWPQNSVWHEGWIHSPVCDKARAALAATTGTCPAAN